MKEQIWQSKTTNEKFVALVDENGATWNVDGPLSESGVKEIIENGATWVGDGTLDLSGDDFDIVWEDKR